MNESGVKQWPPMAVKWVVFALFAGAAVLLLVRGFALAHPHMTPEQIAARIQELDALIPVVKRDRFELILERAAMHDRAGRLDDALLDVRFASALDPKDPRPYRVAAEMLQLRGCNRAALVEYRRAIALATEPHQATFIRAGECCLRLEDWKAARDLFMRAVEASRDKLGRAAKLMAVADAAEKMGDDDAVLAIYDRAIELSEGWPAYVEARADLHFRHRRYLKAAADYAASVKDADPEEAYPKLVRRADSLAAAGKDAEARAQYVAVNKTIDALLAEDPAFIEDMHYWRARVKLALGDLAGARKDIDEALLGMPDEETYLKTLLAIDAAKQKAAGDGAKPDPKAAEARALLADGAAHEAKAKKAFMLTQEKVRAEVAATLNRLGDEALVERLIRAATKADGAARDQAVALARRRLEPLAKDAGKRADWGARAALRLDVIAGGVDDAAGRLAALLTKDPENAMLRRLRLDLASARGDEATAAKDRAFLAALIKRSGDADLLSAAPPAANPPKAEGAAK